MFKKILSILLIPVLLFAAGSVTHEYKLENLSVKNGMVYAKGCRTSMEGFAPMVAVRPIALALPKGYEAVSFEVEYSGLTVMPDEYNLKPFIPSIDLEKGPHPDLHKIKSDVYNINAYFPEKVRSNWFRVQYKCGIPIFYTLVKPVQYNAVTCKVQYYKNFSVKVTIAPVRSPVVYNVSPATISQVQSLVDNPEAVSNFPLTPKSRGAYEYLVVCPSSLEDAWDDFVAFNLRRGMRTQIQTTDYIYSNMSGADNAAKVREYIKQEYTNNNIIFVMLGGDAPSLIPVRYFRAQFYDHHISPDRFNDKKQLGAEIYYSTLDGDWKGTNQYYGEPGTEDMVWDVYAARFPADNTSELNNMMTKTIKYSETPVKDEVTNVFLCGNFLWDDYGVSVYGGDHTEEFWGNCDKNSYETYGFPTSDFSVERLYEKSGSWQVSTLRSRINSFKPAIFEHLGHGNTTYAFQETNTGVTNSNYKNDGTNANFFIITTGACYPGNFDYSSDCIMEQYLSISNGAVATQAFDDSGLEDDDGTNGVGQRIRRYFHDAIFNPEKKMHHLEMALGNAKEVNAEIITNPDIETPPYFGALRFIAYQYSNLGDPALSIWTKTPQDLTVTSTITGKVFQCDTKAAYSMVALCDNTGNTVVTTQFTGIDGKCKIESDQALSDYIDAHPGEKMVVRIKAHNYMPYEGEVDISTGIIDVMADDFNLSTSLNASANAVRINYTLPVQGFVNVSIFSAKGSLVKTLANGNQGSGSHVVNLSNNELGSGVYYCRLRINQTQCVTKFVVTK
ncbi:C25 family cysteine peptidase [Fibrobacterota bacterium]